ncbi:MAG: pilus assembly protein TadG-related protein [Acidimicrobiia bacterium]|nr:pilus assembly protein TadG-related protein [Acidimicrobiia bacterium]
MRRLVMDSIARLTKGRDSETGATLVFVAVILVALLALAAFAIDFGRMYEERRQLQNGADAAALAIAGDCARGLCDGAYDEYAVAETYVDSNARDGAADAWRIDLDLTAQTVTVHNRTEDSGGDNKFDMLFAGVVGFDGFTVGAKATVAWGGLASPIATVPIIISECEWERPYWEGGAGGIIPVPATPPPAFHLFQDEATPWTSPPSWWFDTPADPPGITPDPAWSHPTEIDMDGDGLDDRVTASSFLDIASPAPVPAVLTFHDGATTGSCAAVAGQDSDGDGMLSGGFGWLDIDESNPLPCKTEVYDGLVGADPGASPSTGCDKEDLADLLLGIDRTGSTVFVPFFWDETGLNGSNGEYDISGQGAFRIVGYNFGGQFSAHAAPLTSDPCRPGGIRPLGWTSGNDDRCLVGYFTNAVYHGPGDIGTGGHGVTIIKFTG